MDAIEALFEEVLAKYKTLWYSAVEMSEQTPYPAAISALETQLEEYRQRLKALLHPQTPSLSDDTDDLVLGDKRVDENGMWGTLD